MDSEFDEREGKIRYDRQVRLWGREAQQKIQGMIVSLNVGSGENMTGNGVIQEISKSMVLTGVNAVKLVRIGASDDTHVTLSDVECGYFILPRKGSEYDNHPNALLTLRNQIAELNPLVKVETECYSSYSSWFQGSRDVDHFISFLSVKDLSSIIRDIILNDKMMKDIDHMRKKSRVEKTTSDSKLHVICQLGKYAFSIASNDFNSQSEENAVSILVRSFFHDIICSTEKTFSSLPMSFHVIILASLLICDEYINSSFPGVYLRCVQLQQDLASKGCRLFEGVPEEVVKLLTLHELASSAVACSISGGILCQIILQSISSLPRNKDAEMVTHIGEVQAKSWISFEIGNKVEVLCS
eukprot:Tbor_TRINITY_DN5452_c1_g2::TRINITY_DN5452_c1_g2_i1::g.24870::m.24870/K10684/UBLE1A, SAE1; ubiquitin-like 1-activating enzyme E1 A